MKLNVIYLQDSITVEEDSGVLKVSLGVVFGYQDIIQNLLVFSVSQNSMKYNQRYLYVISMY